MNDAQVSVANNAELNRYEVTVGDELAGFAEYMLTNDLITFTHTEIDPAFEGQGLGSKLVRFALDDVREQGDRKVLPLCPFVLGWMAKHPDYQDLHHAR